MKRLRYSESEIPSTHLAVHERMGPRKLGQGGLVGLLFSALSVATVHAQTVYFSYSDPGQTKAMTEWGADTAWPSADNMRQCVAHMGDEIDVVRLNFFTDEPLDANGQPGPNSKAQLDNQLALAAMAGDKPIALTPSTGSGTHASYLDANDNVIPSLWIDLMTATKDYLGKPLLAIEPFNEPDWTWGPQGTPQTLYDILVQMQSDPNYQGVDLDGCSTLSCSDAAWWYDQVAGPLTRGTTHHIGWGPSSDYVNFIQDVLAHGDVAYNPELHSMAEVLLGCEYGMTGGIWWGAAMRPRGVLVHAVQGKRLGYAENLGNNCAAAVYRAPNGEVYGFAGSVEYYGPTTCYRFVSTDQDLYFNGIGPIREFMYPTWLDQQGGYFNIDATPSLPALDGHRWKIVNRMSGEVLEVASASTTDGANIQTGTDSGALNQQWDITRGRDGYYTIINANSGQALDLFGWSLSNGGNLDQWTFGGGLNQYWFIDNASSGYFYIRSGHSNLYMDRDSASSNVQQWDLNGGQQQEWQFVLADPAGSGVPVAQYAFEGNVSDSTGTYNGTAYGSPAYTTGHDGQAINLDGVGNYVDLPNGVYNSADITIATWVKWNGGNAFQRIFDFGLDTDTYMFLSPSNDQGLMEFSITTGSYQEEQSILTDALPVGQWVHVALTLKGNTGILYINGSPKVAAYIELNPSDLLGSGQQNNYIGKSQWNDPLFSGQIDDFQVYDYALSESDIAAMATVAPDTTAPAAPISLSATAGDSTVSLDWPDNSEPDLASYTVYRSTTSGSGYVAIASGLSASAYTDNTVVNDTTYYYVVTATDTSSNESANSVETSATPVAASSVTLLNTGFELPAAGKIADGFDGAIDVPDWSDFGSMNDSGIEAASFGGHSGTYSAYLMGGDGGAYQMTGYIIQSGDVITLGYWAKVDFEYNAGTTAMAGVLFWDTPNSGANVIGQNVANGLPSSWTYYEYTVAATAASVGHELGIQFQNTMNDWAALDDVTVTVVHGTPDTTPPAAPTGLGATAGDASVSLDWADNAEPDLASYTVYRSTTSGSGYAAIATGVAASTYTDNTAANGTTYYYVVTASDASANESVSSSEVSATPQAQAIVDIYVADIAMSSITYGGHRISGLATITVKDANGAVVPNATVSATWSGAVNESSSGTTDGSGVVVLQSSKVKNGGTYTITVTNVTATGSAYNSGLNVETSDSITAQ